MDPTHRSSCFLSFSAAPIERASPSYYIYFVSSFDLGQTWSDHVVLCKLALNQANLMTSHFFLSSVDNTVAEGLRTWVEPVGINIVSGKTKDQSKPIEKMVMNGPIAAVKRYTSERYSDAVKACLS